MAVAWVSHSLAVAWVSHSLAVAWVSHSLAVAWVRKSSSRFLHNRRDSFEQMSANPNFSSRVWDSSRLAPLLAALSAISLPERQTCAGTQWKQTSVPRVISWCTTVPISRTRSSRALVESERMEESADLESLQITIARILYTTLKEHYTPL